MIDSIVQDLTLITSLLIWGVGIPTIFRIAFPRYGKSKSLMVNKSKKRFFSIMAYVLVCSISAAMIYESNHSTLPSNVLLLSILTAISVVIWSHHGNIAKSFKFLNNKIYPNEIV